MKILVMSDLHLDTGPLDQIKAGRHPGDEVDVVILAGDIDEGTFGLRWARTTFPKHEIFYVAGNHEYYRGVMQEVQAAMVKCAGELDIHLLENSSVERRGVRFLGCTLWTDFGLMGASRRQELMERAGAVMNDYSLIRRGRGEGPKYKQTMLQPEQTRQMHLGSVRWLEQMLCEGVSGQDRGGDPPRSAPELDSRAVPAGHPKPGICFGFDPTDGAITVVGAWSHARLHGLRNLRDPDRLQPARVPAGWRSGKRGLQSVCHLRN